MYGRRNAAAASGGKICGGKLLAVKMGAADFFFQYYEYNLCNVCYCYIGDYSDQCILYSQQLYYFIDRENEALWQTFFCGNNGGSAEKDGLL